MAMSRSIISACFLRIVLPLCLTSCVFLRQDVLTGIYLVLLLYLPLVPLPTYRTMAGHTGFFLRTVMVISFILSLTQISFQVVLLSMPPYGYFLRSKCEGMEKLLRLIGFIMYDHLPLLDCCVHLLPEVIMLFGSVFVQQICERLNAKSEPENGNGGLLITVISSSQPMRETQPTLSQKKAFMILTIVGKYLTLIALCGASILVPSITSAILFFIFLASITTWACYKDLGKGFAIVCRFVAVICLLYLIAIYCYQIQNVRDFVKPDSDIARFFGLQQLHLTKCRPDPRLFFINDKLSWPSFVLPAALLFLYYLLIFESKMLLMVTEFLKKQPEGMRRQMKTRLSQKAPKSSLFRNKTNRWRLATRQVRDICTISPDTAKSVRSSLLPTPSENTPLIRGRESVYHRSGSQGIVQDSQGSIVLNNLPDDQDDKEKEECAKPDILDYLMDALITVVCFITRTSYLATNIIMMTWSITYHSWLTFILLLWASILWMVPNQRSSMLRSSPFLVIYAEFLLIIQFISGMNFLETEFPRTIFGIGNLDQIGIELTPFACKPLLIKTLFTAMFWITLRQYMQERQESHSTSTVERMMAPVHVTVGTAAAMGGEPVSKGSQIIKKFGERLRKFLTKFWIWVVTITLFAIGVMGTKMTLFRIIYTALALIFILTFQLSWIIWRKIMYGFWLTVIIISMVILIMIYTYQFDEIPKLWRQLGLSSNWQTDIGLEKYDTGELLVRLIVPTFFVIITVIQLKYFHKDFLLISDIKSRGTSTSRPPRTRYFVSEEETVSPIEDESLKTEATLAPPTTSSTMDDAKIEEKIKETQSQHVDAGRTSFHFSAKSSEFPPEEMIDTVKHWFKESTEFIWLFLEYHMKKVILLLVMVVCIQNVSAMHFGFVVTVVLGMFFNSKIQDIIIRLISLSTAILLLAKMIYQIDYFRETTWNATCQYNLTGYPNNTAVWLGFEKTTDRTPMTNLLAGYIWIILMVTIYVVTITRQKYMRHLKGRPLSKPHTLFPRITFKDMDKNLLFSVKYLLNYAFYRLGIELTLISMVLLIGTRLDVYALIYAVWLLLFVIISRNTLSRIWYIFNVFVAVTIPLQYAIVVGPPPDLCIEFFYGFSAQNIAAFEWLYLPHEGIRLDSRRLIWDFIVLLLVTRQTRAFHIEYQYRNSEYSGGSNKSIINEVESPSYVNPVPDFISCKKSYLDIAKHAILCSLMWLSCAAVFMAGTNSVTLFSLGYIITSFLLLWQGNDFYLLPINTILKTWNRLIMYNVTVIFCKALLQVPGCIFTDYIKTDACWLMQLFGIVCIKSFSGLSIVESNDPVILRSANIVPSDSTCPFPEQNAGLAWDTLCFVLLLFQRRLFCSHNFVRIVDEAKAMAILAARGAELIAELSQKKIQKQQQIEKTVLEKIKNKMDSIKAAQKRIQGVQPKEPANHHIDQASSTKSARAVRSGDYYMFDDNEEITFLESTKEDSEEHSDDACSGQTPTLGKLMETVLKKDIKQAVKCTEHDASSVSDTKATLKSSKESTSKTADLSDVTLSDDEDKQCSTCQYRSTDATSSKDVTASSGKERVRKLSKRCKKTDKGGRSSSLSSDHGTDCSCAECSPDEAKDGTAKCWDKFVTYVQFAIAFINSAMESIIRFLNYRSRDYRYVIKALDKEKKALKETKNLRLGMRIMPALKWHPVPPGTSSGPATSPLKIEEFDEEGLVTSEQPTFFRLMIAIYLALMSHSDMVCYFAVFILQIRNPSILSLPLPLMVFLWGTLSMPRPTKTFWVTMIAYTEVIVVIKSIAQSDLLLLNNKPVAAEGNQILMTMIGLEKDKFYAIFDLALLLAVFFHRSTLKSLGLWKSTEEFNKSNKGNTLLNLKYVSPQESSGPSGITQDSDATTEITTINLAASDNFLSEPAAFDSVQTYQNQAAPMQCVDSGSSNSFSKLVLNKAKGFFNKLTGIGNKLTADVYAYMFFCDFVNIIVIIFGFSSFGAVRGDGGVTQYIEENKIPFAFLAMLLLQFTLIIIDRSLYLSKSVSGKIVFQYVLVIGIHIWMFFILPTVTDRPFNTVVPPSIWYLVKCCYLLLSAYQIRSGYPTRILGNFLCKNYNLVNMVLFKVFMVIPFVFELRTLMDWIWTETSMTLADWIKMEDIFTQIFQLKCTRRFESKYPIPRGQGGRLRSKILYGGGGLTSLIFLIWFPLVLFSLGNTVGKANMPWDVSLSVKIGSYQPIFATTADNISSLTEDEFTDMKKLYDFAPDAQTFLSEYTADDVAVINLPFYSISIWTIPPPEVQDFIGGLRNPNFNMSIQIKWILNRRPGNQEERTEVISTYAYDLPQNLSTDIADLLEANRSNVTISHLMPKFLKVTSVTPGAATAVPQLMTNNTPLHETNPYVDVVLKLQKDTVNGNITLSMWWDMMESEPKDAEAFLQNLPRNDWTREITIFAFNDKAFPEGLLSYISGKGIIGLYTTFVIVASAYIRSFFIGASAHIMFEDMPCVDRILQLCLDIYLVRERRELDLEEDLLAKLIFLYRSPETMIKWTRPPAEEDIGNDDA